jgi:hypothetical protein
VRYLRAVSVLLRRLQAGEGLRSGNDLLRSGVREALPHLQAPVLCTSRLREALLRAGGLSSAVLQITLLLCVIVLQSALLLCEAVLRPGQLRMRL